MVCKEKTRHRPVYFLSNEQPIGIIYQTNTDFSTLTLCDIPGVEAKFEPTCVICIADFAPLGSSWCGTRGWWSLVNWFPQYSRGGEMLWNQPYLIYPPVNVYITNWKITMLFMSKSTVSMTIFNSKLLVYQRVHIWYMALSNNGVSPESTVWSSYFPISTGIVWGICSKKSRKISQLVSHGLSISCCLIFCRVYIPFFTQCLKNPKHIKTLLMVWLIWYHLEYGFRYTQIK